MIRTGMLRPALLSLVASLAALACGPAADIRGTLVTDRSELIDGGEPEPEDAGVLEDAGTSTVTPRRDGGPGSERCPEPTLTSIREKVFLPTCATADCHAGATPEQGLDLSLPLDTLAARLREPSMQSVSGLALVKPGQQGASWLYLKVFLETPATGSQMPPMMRLEECQLRAIGAWIQAGAPN